MQSAQLPQVTVFKYLGSTLQSNGDMNAEVNKRTQYGWKLEGTEMKMCRWACGHTLRDFVRNDSIRERLNVESITARCREPRLRWFGHIKRRDQDYVGRKTGDSTTWEKKAEKTEAEMDGLCQPRHESHRNDKR